MKSKISTMLGFGILGLSFLASLYVYFWLMLAKPIIQACIAFDKGVLTGTMIGSVILKAMLGGIPAGLVFFVGYIVAKIILEVGYRYGK